MQLSLPLIQDFGLALLSLTNRILNYPYLFQKASNDFVIDQQGFIKITKRVLVSYLIVFLVFSGTGLLFLFNPFGTSTADAAWFNDNWANRKRIDMTVATNASDRSNVDLYLTIDTTGITANLQTSCEDLRFTGVNGDILPYYIQSCNDNSATNKIFVRANLIPKDTTTFTMYMYYGNPSSTAGSNANIFNLYTGINGYWSFEESSAWATNCSTESVLDSSGNGTTFAPCPNASAATQSSSGKFGSAASFDGTNDRLDSLADDAVMDITATDNLTLSAWVNFTNTTTDAGIIQKKGGASASNPGWQFMHYSTGNGGNFCLYISDGSVQEETCTASYTTTATWVHVTAVYDRNSTANSGIYINGVRDISGTFTITEPSAVGNPTNTQTESIGSIGTVASTYLAGKMDDVRMYKRALPQSEISQLYNTTGSIAVTPSFASEEKGPSPTMYWEFDQGQGTTAEDTTANALDGTLNNTPTWQTENMCVASKCLYFDGTNNENVSIADNDKLDFAAADNFTVGAWIKRNGSASANTVILQKSTANIGATYTGYKLYMDASGDLCFDIQDGTNAVDTACTSAIDFDDDAWHFVEGVKAATTSITLYVDGKQRAQDATIASTGTLANAGTLRVGIDSDGLANDWLGFIDEVKVFSDQSARTAAQVAADYNARSNPEGVSQQQGNNIQNMPAALSNGLVRYWKMDEAAANTCTGGVNDSCDASGNAGDGAWTNQATTTSGKYGNGVTFDGTDDYISLGTTDPLPTKTQATFSTWVYLNNVTGTKSIFNKDGASTPFGWAAYISGSDMGFYSDPTANSVTSSISATTWTHLTWVYNAGTVYFYKNGTLLGSQTGFPTVLVDESAATFALGIKQSNLSEDLSGKMDDARVYTRALSGAEVSQLYNWAPGPVVYLRMDEKTGTTAYDSSGNGLNGTITNSPSTVPGKYDGSYQFSGNNSGSNQYINISSGSDLIDIDRFTLNAWVNPQSFADFNQIIDSQQGLGFQNDQYHLYLKANAEFAAYMGGECTSGAGATLTAGTWSYLTVSYNGSTVNLYRNGALVNSCSLTKTAGNSDNIAIGTRSASAYQANAKIDDVRIYNYARTQGQIIEDMNAGHPAPGSPVGTPIGHWKFNEGADNMCSGGSNDVCNSGSSGTALDGTLTASSRTLSGKFGQAFDGATDRRATIADSANLDFVAADDFSISFWFKSDSATNPSANEYFVEKGGIVGTAAVGYAVYTASSGGTVCFGIDDDAVSNFPEDETCSSSDIYDATWHHIVAKKTGTSSLDLYVDGKPNGTADTSISATGTLDNGATFYIGDTNATDGTDEFLGNMDDVKVYRSALTNSQVALDMNQASTQVLGALSDNSTAGQVNAASQEYCVPGDSTTCTAPVGRWDFEEGTGTNARDTSTLGNDLTLTNSPSYGIGKAGKGITFTSSTTDNDHLLRADDPDFDFVAGDSFTLEGWIKLNTLTTGNQYIISKYNEAGYKLHYNGTNGFVACSLDYDSTWTPTDATTTADNVLVDTNWHHVACVKNANSSLTVFFDGKPGSPDTSLTNSTLANTGSLNIGIDSSGTGAGTTGDLPASIDSFRIFNYARTPAQIAWDYNRGAPIAHWKMDECQGTTINNSSGSSSFAGTLVTAGTVGTCTTSGQWFNGAAGKRNYSFQFTNDNTRAYAPLGSSIPTGDFTYSAWIKPTTTSVFDTIFAAESALTGDTDELMIFLSDTPNKLTVRLNGSDAAVSAKTIADGEWVLVTVTRVSSTITIYLNGAANATGSDGTALTFDSVCNLSIGADQTGGCDESGGTWDGWFDGLIDDAKVFNYGLTASQVQSLYNDGAIRYGPVTGAP